MKTVVLVCVVLCAAAVVTANENAPCGVCAPTALKLTSGRCCSSPYKLDKAKNADEYKRVIEPVVLCAKILTDPQGNWKKVIEEGRYAGKRNHGCGHFFKEALYRSTCDTMKDRIDGIGLDTDETIQLSTQQPAPVSKDCNAKKYNAVSKKLCERSNRIAAEDAKAERLKQQRAETVRRVQESFVRDEPHTPKSALEACLVMYKHKKEPEGADLNAAYAKFSTDVRELVPTFAATDLGTLADHVTKGVGQKVSNRKVIVEGLRDLRRSVQRDAQNFRGAEILKVLGERCASVLERARTMPVVDSNNEIDGEKYDPCDLLDLVSSRLTVKSLNALTDHDKKATETTRKLKRHAVRLMTDMVFVVAKVSWNTRKPTEDGADVFGPADFQALLKAAEGTLDDETLSKVCPSGDAVDQAVREATTTNAPNVNGKSFMDKATERTGAVVEKKRNKLLKKLGQLPQPIAFGKALRDHGVAPAECIELVRVMAVLGQLMAVADKKRNVDAWQALLSGGSGDGGTVDKYSVLGSKYSLMWWVRRELAKQVRQRTSYLQARPEKRITIGGHRQSETVGDNICFATDVVFMNNFVVRNRKKDDKEEKLKIATKVLDVTVGALTMAAGAAAAAFGGPGAGTAASTSVALIGEVMKSQATHGLERSVMHRGIEANFVKASRLFLRKVPLEADPLTNLTYDDLMKALQDFKPSLADKMKSGTECTYAFTHMLSSFVSLIRPEQSIGNTIRELITVATADGSGDSLLDGVSPVESRVMKLMRTLEEQTPGAVKGFDKAIKANDKHQNELEQAKQEQQPATAGQ